MITAVNYQETGLVSMLRLATFRVDELSLSDSAFVFEGKLKAQKGVRNVSVYASEITVSYDAEQILLDAVVGAVREEAGKQVEVVGDKPLSPTRKVSLRVGGMTCGACARKVSSALEASPYTSDVDVSFDSKLANLSFCGSDVKVLVDLVRDKAGKSAVIVSDDFPGDEAATPSVVTQRNVTLRVDGMTCNRCLEKVKDALELDASVSDVDISLDTKLASVAFSGSDAARLVELVRNAGKDAVIVGEDRKLAAQPTPVDVSARCVTLRIDGMTCGGCVGRVAHALKSIPSTSDVKVSLESKCATLLFPSHDLTPLIDAVWEGAGKKAFIVENDSRAVEGKSSVAYAASPALVPRQATLLSPSGSIRTTKLRVFGMTCSSCVGVVEKVLNDIQGVSSAKVNLLAGRATVVHDIDFVKASELCDAVLAAGYKPQALETAGSKDQDGSHGDQPQEFRIGFQTDVQAQSASRVLRALENVSMVVSDRRTATVFLSPGIPKAKVLRALESDGGFGKMTVRPSRGMERVQLARGEGQGATDVVDEEATMWRRKFVIALAFFIPIFLTQFLHPNLSIFSMQGTHWLHFILSTPIQFGCGWGFYRASYFALRKGRATMDVLVSVSTSIAYFSSLAVLVFGFAKEGSNSLGHSSMFRVSSMIITMVLVGKWLESSAKKRAAAGVAALSGLAPESAVLFDVEDGVPCHTQVPVAVLSIGDTVQLIPGDRVPVDGEVVEGLSAVNESMLTGESNPVPKSGGDIVFGGTVNGRGSLIVKATAVGSDAVLSQIVKLVNDAQTARAPVEAMADRISAVFVPVVVALSVCVFIGWYTIAVLERIPQEWYEEEGKFFFALLFALETMVIACPCALGLATPTAVMVASEVGTGLGVLFRGGAAAIESASKVKTVVFDKTGTLTMGKPEVAAMMVGERGKAATEEAEKLLSDLVMLVESQSHHPLAEALCKFLKRLPQWESRSNGACYKLNSVEEVPGCGIMATVNEGQFSVRVGTCEFALNGVDKRTVFTESEICNMERMEREGGLTIVVGIVNGIIAIVYGLEDTLREESGAVVEELHSMGFDSALVTGDSSAGGRAAGLRAGIGAHAIHTGALPWTKVSIVKQYEPACFVGDGVNDAPALSGSSVGIAVGAGAPVAAEAASVVVVRHDLWGVVDAIDLARATLRRVRFNFYWAIGYNLVSIPMAAGILYPSFQVRVPPMVASMAMALSSTCVVLSSLALRWYKPRRNGSRHMRMSRSTKKGSPFSVLGESVEDDWRTEKDLTPLLKEEIV